MSEYIRKIKAIQEAMKAGQKFYVHTYLGVLEVVSVDGEGTWARTGSGFTQRTWAICSTEVDRWYEEVLQHQDINQLMQTKKNAGITDFVPKSGDKIEITEIKTIGRSND